MPGPASAVRREPAPKGEGDRLRAEILEAADTILRASGNAEAVTMRAVAARVGCTPSALYLHFADRTELIYALCSMHFMRLDRSIGRAIRGLDDPVEELRAVGRAYVRFGLRHPEQYRILFMGHPSDMPADVNVEEMLAIGGFQRAVHAVERCMDAGAVVRGEPFEVATLLWVVVHGFTSALISKPWFPWGDTDALLDRLLATQLEGLASH